MEELEGTLPVRVRKMKRPTDVSIRAFYERSGWIKQQTDENVRCESWPGDGVDDDDAENRELYKCNKSDWQCQTGDLAKPAN